MPPKLEDFAEKETSPKLAERAFEKAVGPATGLETPIHPERYTMEREGLTTTIRGYIGDRLVFRNVFKAAAEWTEEGERRWTYQFEDGSTRTVVLLHPGEPLA